MFELRIVKNTLPYIHPYSITATKNGYCQIVGNYKNKAIAEKAKANFEHLLQYGIIPEELENLSTLLKPNNTGPSPAINYFKERMKKPQGDQPPKLPPSKKRKIVL